MCEFIIAVILAWVGLDGINLIFELIDLVKLLLLC